MYIYEFIYYCYYKTFKLIKRRVEIDHILASEFYAIIIATNFLALLAISGIIKIFYNNGISLIIPVFGALILFIVANRFYFINSGKYLRIIAKFQAKIISDRIPVIIAIILTILTFVGILITAILIDRQLT